MRCCALRVRSLEAIVAAERDTASVAQTAFARDDRQSQNLVRNASRSPSQAGPASPDTPGSPAPACVFKVL